MGKSTILQSIAFLAQSVGSVINYDGRLVDLNSFVDTVFGHRRNRKVRIELSYSIAGKEGSLLQIGPGRKPILLHGDVTFTVEVGEGGIIEQELRYPDMGITCNFRRPPKTGGRSHPQRLVLNEIPINFRGEGISVLLGWNLYEVASRGKPMDSVSMVATQKQIDVSNMLLRVIRTRLSNTFYFSTTRAIKEWSQELRETNSFGTLGQDTISMLHQIYSNEPHTFRRIAKWIEKMGVGTLFSTTKGANSSILLEDPMLGIKSNLVSSGFGINQLISVIGQCFASPQESLIMIEEPEISLHPGAIGVLTDMIVETISDRKQVFLSSHSDRLALELWARVKLGLVNRKDVALYLVEKSSEGVTAREIKLDQRVKDVMKEIRSLYKPSSPLDALLGVAEESGDRDLSKKDLSEL